MNKWSIWRIVFTVPLIISLMVCLVSMITGVNTALFGIARVDYGTTAFMWMSLFLLNFLWWLYIICIVGIIVTTVMNIRNKKSLKQNGGGSNDKT